MHIQCLGINHHTASVYLREKLAFTENDICVALTGAKGASARGAFLELLILSTCNRTELYSASDQISLSALEAFLADARGVSSAQFRSNTYHYTDENAVHHLMEVAAGLDSLVLGEHQILGQVTKALELAHSVGSSGQVLTRLFQQAVHAGRRARAETKIARNPVSVSSLAVSLAEKTVVDFSKAQIVVLGAGETAELVVESLRKRGGDKITVVNRTLERAQTLAKRWQAATIPFEDMERAIAIADVLVSSTGAPHFLITPEMVKRGMAGRASRPLVMIDIAVPRDVDPGCNQVANVLVYDMDSLQKQLERSRSRRQAEVTHVRAILNEELSVFMAYFNSLEMLPLIAGLRRQAEHIRQTELERTLRRMPGLSEAERARIDALSQALIKKILDTPTQYLKEQANQPAAMEYAAMARNLFGLPPGD